MLDEESYVLFVVSLQRAPIGWTFKRLLDVLKSANFDNWVILGATGAMCTPKTGKPHNCGKFWSGREGWFRLKVPRFKDIVSVRI